VRNNNLNKAPSKKGILLTVGVVFRCKPEKAEGIVDTLGKEAEIVFIKQGFGKLWIKEENPECERGFGND
jgi:hypothetical protein